MPKKQDTSELNYHLLNEELDKILDSLQGADLDIDQAVIYYERGLTLVKLLEDYLKTVENKIKTVTQQTGHKTV